MQIRVRRISQTEGAANAEVLRLEEWQGGQAAGRKSEL